MISVNLDTIILNPELLFQVYDLKFEKDSILLYDLPEGSRLFPLDSSSYDDEGDFTYSLFSKVHKILYKHKYDVWFLCSDLNIKERYTKWCKQIGVKEKCKVLCFPFTVRGPGTDFINSPLPSYLQEQLDELKKNKKTKNFCQLICSPATPRLATVDRYYTHKNYEYSYVPQFHHHGGHIKHWNVPSWFSLGNCNGQLPNIEENIFKNGFDAKKDFKLLNELELAKSYINEQHAGVNSEKMIIDNIEVNKLIFNTFPPVESFNSCCDVVLETYMAGPTYFTEKTWKQFLYEKPFISIGVKGSNHSLLNLGFELYDEIFDYSFDLEENPLIRLKGFWSQIEKYLDWEVSAFKEKLEIIEHKLIHNRKTYIDWITRIDKTIDNYTNSNLNNFYHLFNHIYLSEERSYKEHLSESEFNVIKKICLGFD
jgi:hypothetical protein